MIVIGGITFFGGLLVLVLAPLIVRIAMGPKYTASVDVLRFMALTPFACAINNIYGTQGMLNFGMKPQYSRIIVLSAVFSNAILFPLCYRFKAPGAASAALITETVVTIAMGMMLYGKGVNLLPRLSYLRDQISSLSAFQFKKALGR